jgi:hypothetical protein
MSDIMRTGKNDAVPVGCVVIYDKDDEGLYIGPIAGSPEVPEGGLVILNPIDHAKLMTLVQRRKLEIN